MPSTGRRSARCTRRRRRSCSATRSRAQRPSSRGTGCSSGCPPATTARAGISDTSRCRSPRNSRNKGPPSSSSTPCVPAGCCTCPDHRYDTCTSPPHAHTRSCSSSTPARHSPPPTSRSPGSSCKRSHYSHRSRSSTSRPSSSYKRSPPTPSSTTPPDRRCNFPPIYTCRPDKGGTHTRSRQPWTSSRPHTRCTHKLRCPSTYWPGIEDNHLSIQDNNQNSKSQEDKKKRLSLFHQTPPCYTTIHHIVHYTAPRRVKRTSKHTKRRESACHTHSVRLYNRDVNMYYCSVPIQK